MSGKVIILTSELHFHEILKDADDKLVVVDFFAAWCGPCRKMVSKYKELANKYKNIVFVKLDVEKFEDIAEGQEIASLPTFVLYKHQKKIDEICGASADNLEDLIRKHSRIDHGLHKEDQSTKGSIIERIWKLVLKIICGNSDYIADHPVDLTNAHESTRLD